METKAKKFRDLRAVEMITQTEGRTMVVFQGGVYDVTKFLNDHPGGKEILKQYSGKVIDDIFFSHYHHRHSETARKKLETFKIGVIEK